MQIKTLGEIQEYLDTLTTEERMRAFMDMQLQVLRTDGKASTEAIEQYRQPTAVCWRQHKENQDLISEILVEKFLFFHLST